MNEENSPLKDHWEEWMRVLLLGTDQASGTEQLVEWGATLGWEGEGMEQWILEAIGKTALLRRVASPLGVKHEGVSISPAETETTPLSARAIAHLKSLLYGEQRLALSEFLRLLHTTRKTIAPEFLPDLVETCFNDGTLFPMLLPAIGERGRWLVAQHPVWKIRLPGPAQYREWRMANTAEMKTLLTAYRQNAPEEALQSLVAAWSDMDHKEKSRLLPALVAGLSQADEPFLETCLSEPRKEVRIAAAELLSRLPDSQLVSRCFHAARGILNWGQNRMVVQLPHEVPKSAASDGIYPTGSKLPGGLPLNWAQQLVARIPITYWTKHWEQPLAPIIIAFTAAQYAKQWQWALAESLLRFPNEEAARILIKWWLINAPLETWNAPVVQDLLRQTSNEVFNDAMIAWLEQAGPLVAEQSLGYWWLTLAQQEWSQPLSKIIVLGFQDMVQSGKAHQHHLWHYRRLLEVASYQSDPELMDTLKRGWAIGSSTIARWMPDLEKMWQTLHFRRDMRRTLLQ
ncbi:MAG: DUF5691 domain-containing protein [Saprospiraceae bacterium]